MSARPGSAQKTRGAAVRVCAEIEVPLLRAVAHANREGDVYGSVEFFHPGTSKEWVLPKGDEWTMNEARENFGMVSMGGMVTRRCPSTCSTFHLPPL